MGDLVRRIAGDPGPWPIRVIWLLLPLVAGPAVAVLLDERSRPVGWLTAALLFGGWAVGLVAALVPHPLGLTALRVLAPAALGVALLAALGADVSAAGAGAAVAAGSVASAVMALGSTVDAFVDGGSYGSERRWALRVPAGLLLGPVPLAWALAVAGPTAGPLLLAAGKWLPGAVLLLVGVPSALVALRSLHGLACRWLVFVPAGFVLADRTVLREAALFPRATVARIAAADTGTTATDLTAGALGLVVEVVLSSPVATTVRRGRRGGADAQLRAFLISPVQPGALLREAARHRLPTG